MPTLEVEFEVVCGICGHGCCRGTDISQTHRGSVATVTCPSCKGTIAGLEARVDDLENQLAARAANEGRE